MSDEIVVEDDGIIVIDQDNENYSLDLDSDNAIVINRVTVENSLEVSSNDLVVTQLGPVNSLDLGPENVVQLLTLGAQGPRGVQGPEGPEGPRGPEGPQHTTRRIDQYLPVAVWMINHNLNYFPHVTVVDSTNEVVNGTVSYIDGNNLKIEFVAAFSGYVLLS